MTSNESPRVIHLAAGEGTRLRPITDDRPKPLVELGDTSLLERNLQTFTDLGITDQIVVTGYRAEQIRNLGVETVHNPEYAETDMVYSLFSAEDAFPSDRDLVISYGDVVYAPRVVEALLDCAAPVCVIVDRDWRDLWEARFDNPLADAETLSLNEENRVTEIGAPPECFESIDAQYIGLIKIHAGFVDQFTEFYYDLATTPDGETKQASVEMTEFIQELIDAGHHVEGVPINGGWLEVDTIQDLELYEEALTKDDPCHHIDYL